MNVAIIIPTYKETENIKVLIKKIFQNISAVEVFIIDDSPSKEILNEIKEFDNVNYTFRGKKMGRGSAVIAGMKEAIKNENNKIFIEMDADLSHEPNEIREKLAYFSENSCEMLLSSRYLKKSDIKNWPIQRKVFSFFANKLAKFLLVVPVSDYTNGYRIYSRSAVNHVIINCGKIGDGFIILSEILVELYYNSFKIEEIPSIFVNRTRGESSLNFIEIFNSLVGLLKVYKLKKKLSSNLSK